MFQIIAVVAFLATTANAGVLQSAPLVGSVSYTAPDVTVVKQPVTIDQPEVRYHAVPRLVETAPIVKTTVVRPPPLVKTTVVQPTIYAAPAPAPIAYAAAPAPVAYAAAPLPAPLLKAAPLPYAAAPAPISYAPAPAPLLKAAPAIAPYQSFSYAF